MKIIIIGAGIGGLTTAIAIKKALPDAQIDCYERVDVMRPIGAAISVWSNGVKVLKKLGLGNQIERCAGDMKRMSYYDKAGQKLCDFSLLPLYERVKQRACPIARTSLQNILLKGAYDHGVNVHLGKRAIDYTQSADKVSVTFEDGENVVGDLLIVAEGTHSKLRDKIIGRKVSRNYVGYVNFNGSVPISTELGPPTTWVQYVGDGKRVSMMPMGDSQFYFFFDVCLPPGTTANPELYRQELAKHFEGWPAPVQKLIQTMDTIKVARVEIHDIEELDSFVSGRAVMIGDAAHGTAPDLGQGGCQAMEDAWVLANALKKYCVDVAAALREFDEMRVDRTVQLVSRARKRADMIHGKHMPTTLAWYEELAKETGEDIMEGMAKTILGAPVNLDSYLQSFSDLKDINDRDLKGYNNQYPSFRWPNDAKIALSFVVNYEEGGENTVVNGDRGSEVFLNETPGGLPRPARDMNMETQYEYGTRAGVHRLLAIFRRFKYKFTAYAVGRAVELTPGPVKQMHDEGHEVCSHNYRWIDYHGAAITPEIEAEHCRKAIEAIKQATSLPPRGWYTGRIGPDSRRIVIREYRKLGLELLYDSDAYNDDLPYWVKVDEKEHLVIPYTLDQNDMKYCVAPGFSSPDGFFAYLKDAFDVLYQEGMEGTPKMMSIGLHCRLAGKPGRAAALQRFLEYVSSKEGVWVATREEIARFWRKEFPVQR